MYYVVVWGSVTYLYLHRYTDARLRPPPKHPPCRAGGRCEDASGIGDELRIPVSHKSFVGERAIKIRGGPFKYILNTVNVFPHVTA